MRYFFLASFTAVLLFAIGCHEPAHAVGLSYGGTGWDVSRGNASVIDAPATAGYVARELTPAETAERLEADQVDQDLAAPGRFYLNTETHDIGIALRGWVCPVPVRDLAPNEVDEASRRILIVYNHVRVGITVGCEREDAIVHWTRVE